MTGRSVPLLRLALLAALSAAIVYLEVRRPFGAFRLVTFVLFFFLLADLTSLLRGGLRDGLLILSSLALGLSIVEGVAALSDHPSRVMTKPQLTIKVPVMGWGPKSAGRFHAKKIDAKTGKTVYDVAYTIDSDLLRETQSCTTCATVAFFGGSFTFGEGLNDADTLPQVFANSVDRKIRAVNLGYSGYGPEQFLRELQTGRFDKVIGDPKLVIFLTAPWHAERTSCKAYWVIYGPRYSLENGKPVYHGRCFEGAALHLREWAQHSAAYRSYVEPYLERVNHGDIDLYIRILLAATHLAKEKYGAATIIPFLRVPEAYLKPTGFTNDEIIKRLQDGGAHVVDVSLAHETAEHAALRIPGDGHPTGLANRLRATILKDYITQHFAALLPPQQEQANQ
jgi:hypothetical protein